jgi:hypothetical protein
MRKNANFRVIFTTIFAETGLKVVLGADISGPAERGIFP